MTDIFLARQPIFNRKQEIHGYEIFYRSGFTNHYTGIDGDEDSSRVIINAFQHLGLDTLTGGRPAFVNFSGKLIKKEIATLFSNEHLVIEILETVNFDEDVLIKCRQLKAAGYTIVLDDYVCQDERQWLLEVADLIKVDLLNIDRQKLSSKLPELKRKRLSLLAEKVETWEDFRFAFDLGFHLFQGYFFSRPEIITSKGLSPLQLNYLSLISQLNRTEMDFAELAEIVAKDLYFTHSLLRLVNSAAFALGHHVGSIKQALVILGEREIRKWVTLLALQKISMGKPQGPIITSLVRARFLQLLAQQTDWGHYQDELYLAGLFSLLDVLLQRSLSTVLAQVQLDDNLKEMLLHGTGPYGDLWSIVLAYERGHFEIVESRAWKFGLEPALISESYIQAIQWPSWQ